MYVYFTTIIIFLKDWNDVGVHSGTDSKKKAILGRQYWEKYVAPQVWVVVPAPLWGRRGCIKGIWTNPSGSSFLCRFQHSLSPRSPAEKITRPTSRSRMPRETTTSPSSRTRSTTALPPVSTPCTWDSSPPATMSTSTQLPDPTVNWTMKRATTPPPPTPGCEERAAAGAPGAVHVHAYHETLLFFPPANLVR